MGMVSAQAAEEGTHVHSAGDLLPSRSSESGPESSTMRTYSQMIGFICDVSPTLIHVGLLTSVQTEHPYKVPLSPD